jgi:hypothetical protein
MTSDHAQSTRVAQRGTTINQSVRMVESTELPEVAYKGQIVYLTDLDCLSIYDGAAWQQVGNVGELDFSVTYVGPVAPTGVNDGDHWLDTATQTLYTWNGSSWETAVGLNDVTDYELAPQAVTDKHTIIGAVFKTSVSGNRIQMRNDGTGGVIEGYTDSGEASPSKINPGFSGGRPTLQLRAGSQTATPGGTLLLYGDNGGNRKAEINCDTDVAGNLSCTQQFFIGDASAAGSGTAAEIGADGRVKKITSSRRYKDDIEDLELDVHQALKLRPRQYKDKVTGTKLAGFVAEEAAELGLDRWVGIRSEDKKPESFRYMEWTAVLQKVCQAQQRELNELKLRVTVLEKQVGRQP